MGTFEAYKVQAEEAKQEESEPAMIPQPAKSNPGKLIDPNYGNSNVLQAEDNDSGKAPASHFIGSSYHQKSSPSFAKNVDEPMKNEGDKSDYKDITGSLMRTRKDLSKTRPPN
jgi:hypothetical protein